MKKKSTLNDYLECSNPDPSTFSCTTSFKNCVKTKHSLTREIHRGMVFNPDIEPRIVSFDGLSLDPSACGDFLIAISFDPTITDSNEDISIEIVSWPAKSPKFQPKKGSVNTVYYSDVLFNALNEEIGIVTIEMRKGVESGLNSPLPHIRPKSIFPNTVLIECINAGGLTKYRGDLTSMIPLVGGDDYLP